MFFCYIEAYLTSLYKSTEPRARDSTTLYSPLLHLNLTCPQLTSLAFSYILYRLTSTFPSCLNILISNHAVIKRNNS